MSFRSTVLRLSEKVRAALRIVPELAKWRRSCSFFTRFLWRNHLEKEAREQVLRQERQRKRWIQRESQVR